MENQVMGFRKVRVTCADCRNHIELTADQLNVEAKHDGGDTEYSYVFTCYVCSTECAYFTDRRLAEMLRHAGAKFIEWSVPLELREPRDFGEPITHDELLTFHLAIETDPYLVRHIDG